MNLTESWNHAVELELQGRQEAQSLPGWAVPTVSSQFHHSVRHINHNSFKNNQKLGVMIDDQLTFSDHITKTAQSCRFAVFNIKKIRLFLSEHDSQLFVQALVLSRLDYWNALLAGLPASSIKPLQLIQRVVARLMFNEPKRMHVTPLFINLQKTGYQ